MYDSLLWALGILDIARYDKGFLTQYLNIYLHLLTCLLFDYRSLDFILPDSNTLLESESFFIPVPNSDEDQTESGMLYHLQNLPINYQKPSFE